MESLSDTRMNLCGNILLKSVKMHFSGNTEILVFYKVHQFFHGLQNSFLFLNGTFDIVKNRFSQKKKVKLNVLKKKCEF